VGTKLATSLHPGAVEHYENAESYERRYEARTEDVAYYLRRARDAESVLEYGAGAGRLTLQLAQRGKQVTAVDASAAMIALLKKRQADLPRQVRSNITPVLADMRTFRTKKQFDCVIAAFHTVAHLYSLPDIRAFFSRAFAHVRPGGTIELDLPLPWLDMTSYDPIAQVRVTEMDGPDGPELLTLRCFPPQEIAMHLDYAGFSDIKLRSDFTAARIDRETMVFTVSARRPS
jgi:SAM-dependent methyltransferase